MKILALLIPIFLFVSCSDEEIQQAVPASESNQETVLEDLDFDNDGVIDSEDCAVNDNTLWQTVIGYEDKDNDTYGVNDSATQFCLGESLNLPEGFSNREGDCNDDNFTIKPFVAEILGDEIDNNCDDGIDNYPIGPLGSQDSLIISEFYDGPVGQNNLDEWIEIYNSSNYTVDMTNIYIDNGSQGAKHEIFENVLLPPKSFLVIGQENAFQAQVKYRRHNRSSILKKTLGELTLRASDYTTVLFEIRYNEAEEGFSYQLDLDSLMEFQKLAWCKVHILRATAGAKNYSCDE
ncbi:MAG: hypothetical protein HOE90_22620 [Bacteriovoracaceae bacterium]|nr:hypothetical protein [Bacteriovoracaceae bacterium]